jgi:hypothetical protein
MALGEDGDPRMVGFGHERRFNPQFVYGGEGSALISTELAPFGGSNAQPGFPPLTFPSFGNPTFTLPGITLPPALPPVVIQPAGTGGTATTTTITVEDPSVPTSLSGIDTIQFTGTGLVQVAPGATSNIAVVEYQDTGGGGGGLLYGQITSVGAKNATKSIWSYTVTLSGGSVVTAYNLLERANTGTVGYGYTVDAGTGDKITGTSYYIRSVPANTYVRLEQTSAVSGVLEYWFSAPNRIDGGC